MTTKISRELAARLGGRMNRMRERIDKNKYDWENLPRQELPDLHQAIREGSTEQVLAWLRPSEFDVPDRPYARKVFRLVVATANSRSVEEVAEDILHFYHQAQSYEQRWQIARNRGDAKWEREERRSFVAEIRKFLANYNTKQEKINEIVKLVMDDEHDPWMRKGSKEWLEIQATNAEIYGLSLDEWIARQEKEFAERH